MKKISLFGIKAVILVVGLSISLVYAVNTSFWEVANKAEFRKGEMLNVIINAAGELTLGRETKCIKPEEPGEPSFWTSITSPENEIYLGTGTGKVYKLVKNKLTELYNTQEPLVTSFAFGEKGDLFVGTIGNGKIFKIDKTGKGELFTTLKCGTNIWVMTYESKEKLLFAATGPEGKLYKITSDGQAEIFYDTKKQNNILSLVSDQKGYLYFGTTNPGVLYRISLKGKPEVLADFGEAEIKSIVYEKGNLYVAVNSGVKVSPEAFLEAVSLKKSTRNSHPDLDEKSPPISAPLPAEKDRPLIQSTVYQVSETGAIKEIITFNECYITNLKIDKNGQLFAGTDAGGKVYQISPTREYSIPFDFEANQVLTLEMDQEGNLAMIATGGEGAIYLVEKSKAKKGHYLSSTFDAKFRAQWGNLSWKGKGKLTFQTRSGNTSKPDETWSDWSKEMTSFPAKITSPPARYLQFKVIWDKDEEAVLREVSCAYLVDNQVPKIESFNLQFSRSQEAASSPPRSGQPKQATAIIKITWQASDPDGDILGARLYYREENHKGWRLLNPKDLILENTYDWDTENVPDGKYLVKLEITDEKSNPPATAHRVEKISLPVLIDNTRPTIKEIKIQNNFCVGKVMDNLSPIKKIEFSFDGDEWQLVYPTDNILDDLTEEFKIELPKLKKGLHTILIRAYDEADNLGVAQVEFEIE